MIEISDTYLVYTEDKFGLSNSYELYWTFMNFVEYKFSS